MKNRIKILISLCLATLFFVGCSSKDEYSGELRLTTKTILNVSYKSVDCGGELVGGKSSDMGVCWSTTPAPLVTDHKISVGAGTGKYSVSITDLTEGTNYYLRAYAIVDGATIYADQKTFTTYTKGEPTLAILSTIEKGISSATFRCRIITDAGQVVTERGLCWSSENAEPTVDDNKIKDPATGVGTYDSKVEGLVEGAWYYVRPYVVSSAGTTYGAALRFRTLLRLAEITTSDVLTYTGYAAAMSGELLSVGGLQGAAVSEIGIEYGTDPTLVTSTKIANPTKLVGVFTAPKSDKLGQGTKYYYRAYAINQQGTAYGEIKSFTSRHILRDLIRSAADGVTAPYFNAFSNVPAALTTPATYAQYPVPFNPSSKQTYFISSWKKAVAAYGYVFVGLRIYFNYDNAPSKNSVAQIGPVFVNSTGTPLYAAMMNFKAAVDADGYLVLSTPAAYSGNLNGLYSTNNNKPTGSNPTGQADINEFRDYMKNTKFKIDYNSNSEDNQFILSNVDNPAEFFHFGILRVTGLAAVPTW